MGGPRLSKDHSTLLPRGACLSEAAHGTPRRLLNVCSAGSPPLPFLTQEIWVFALFPSISVAEMSSNLFIFSTNKALVSLTRLSSCSAFLLHAVLFSSA